MATYDLEEQEQLDELKTWWKMYGNLVTGLIIVVSLAVVGWQGWHWWQRNQAAQASMVYSELLTAAAQADVKKVRDLAGSMIDKHGRTAYAGYAVLVSAKILAEKGDPASAKTQLAWALDHSADDSVKAVASLRLAALLLDEKNYDEAMSRISINPPTAFAARFAEMRGDILGAQGKTADAAGAYQAAIASLESLKAQAGDARVQETYRDVLQGKLDALGAIK